MSDPPYGPNNAEIRVLTAVCSPSIFVLNALVQANSASLVVKVLMNIKEKDLDAVVGVPSSRPSTSLRQAIAASLNKSMHIGNEQPHAAQSSNHLVQLSWASLFMTVV